MAGRSRPACRQSPSGRPDIARPHPLPDRTLSDRTCPTAPCPTAPRLDRCGDRIVAAGIAPAGPPVRTPPVRPPRRSRTQVRSPRRTAGGERRSGRSAPRVRSPRGGRSAPGPIRTGRSAPRLDRRGERWINGANYMVARSRTGRTMATEPHPNRTAPNRTAPRLDRCGDRWSAGRDSDARVGGDSVAGR